MSDAPFSFALSQGVPLCHLVHINTPSSIPLNDPNILVEAEDGTSQQKRLRHVVEQPCGHVVGLYHLIRHECDAAHDEQHRTGVLGNFESPLVFYGIRRIHSSFYLPYKVTI